MYHSLKEEFSKLGIIFEDMTEALKKYPDLVKKYFTKSVPMSDHKFAALHYAVWSG
jgi:Fe-S cluster assembly protein SufB